MFLSPFFKVNVTSPLTTKVSTWIFEASASYEKSIIYWVFRSFNIYCEKDWPSYKYILSLFPYIDVRNWQYSLSEPEEVFVKSSHFTIIMYCILSIGEFVFSGSWLCHVDIRFISLILVTRFVSSKSKLHKG